MKSKLSRNFISNSLTLNDGAFQITFAILEVLKMLFKNKRKKSLVTLLSRE